jgi:hypothetical protein
MRKEYIHQILKNSKLVQYMESKGLVVDEEPAIAAAEETQRMLKLL